MKAEQKAKEKEEKQKELKPATEAAKPAAEAEEEHIDPNVIEKRALWSVCESCLTLTSWFVQNRSTTRPDAPTSPT